MEVMLVVSLDMVVKTAPAPLSVINTIEFQCILGSAGWEGLHHDSV